MILDEPTNDLDIDTLNVLEDYLDRWPGTLIVVSHDRYFLERVTDVSYALLGDGTCVLLPGGVTEYLERRRAAHPSATVEPAGVKRKAKSASTAAQERQRKKNLARIESQLAKVEKQVTELHEKMAANGADFELLAELDTQLRAAEARQSELEDAWLETSD